jgi:hypothetical protein
MEVLWQRIYAHGTGCYRGEITVSWNSEPFHRAESGGDCSDKCRKIVQRDMSKQDVQFSKKRCLAATEPQFKLTESALVDTPCEGQPMGICQCTGLYNHTNIIKPKSELENEWPGGIPFYPKDCEMEKIGEYFADKLPGKTVSAVRKENNDCPQLRQDHPVIENFEDDLGMLSPEQKKQAANEAQRVSQTNAYSAKLKLPLNHPYRIDWRRKQRVRQMKYKQGQTCPDESLKSQEQVKRLKAHHSLGETSQPASNTDNQRLCPIADIENAHFPMNDLGRFGTLITPSMLEPIAGNDVELTELPSVPSARPLNIDLNEKPEEEDEVDDWAS